MCRFVLRFIRYFVNDEDEIRSIENPDCYYKFFISKNMRVNERQRFHFNGDLQCCPQTWIMRLISFV